MTASPLTRSDICPWLTPFGYTRNVRPHLRQRYRYTSTWLYIVSLSAFSTCWCILTCLLPQSVYTHSAGSFISFGSTFGSNNCKRIAFFLLLFSLLYFTPLSPLGERSPKDHPGKSLTKRQTWVFFCLILTSTLTSERLYKGLRPCIQMNYQHSVVKYEPN